MMAAYHFCLWPLESGASGEGRTTGFKPIPEPRCHITKYSSHCFNTSLHTLLGSLFKYLFSEVCPTVFYLVLVFFFLSTKLSHMFLTSKAHQKISSRAEGLHAPLRAFSGCLIIEIYSIVFGVLSLSLGTLTRNSAHSGASKQTVFQM